MKKKTLIKLYYLSVSFSILLVLILSGCKKNIEEEVDTSALQLVIQDSTEKNPFEIERKKWQKTNKRICVIFGYDFNSPEIVESYTQLLSENFGLEEEDGLIYSIIYPDSFKHARAYVSELTSFITECNKDLIGIVILGAPANTHYALGRIQDYWNMNPPFPIFSLFPQDESLGMESTCDFVLDKYISTDITGNALQDTDSNQTIKEAPEVLISVINYMRNLQGPFPKDASVQAHVVQMLKGYKIQYYIDPETGLHAINHFVLH